MIKAIKIAAVMLLAATLSGAQTIVLTTRDGKSTEVGFTGTNLKKRVVVLDSGTKLSYSEITEIARPAIKECNDSAVRTA